MAELTEEVRLARLRRKRRVLRAFNGAGLGVLLGGLIGACIGGTVLGVLFSKGGGPDGLAAGALYGVFPGMFGGFWIGMTAVMRDGPRGISAGTAMGAAVGLLYALVLSGVNPLTNLSTLGVYGLFTVPSGLVGGLILSSLIRAIRSRWNWWTRWEE